MPHALAPVVKVIERRAGQTLPLQAHVMAVALGLRLTPRPGAVYSHRGLEIVFDPRWSKPVREQLIARACAVFVLHRAGLLRESSQEDIAWLAKALCGVCLYEQVDDPEVLRGALAVVRAANRGERESA